MWLRPKGLKVCSYVEKYAELKKINCYKNPLVHKVAICKGMPKG